jgi:hypothetical protein
VESPLVRGRPRGYEVVNNAWATCWRTKARPPMGWAAYGMVVPP